VRMNNQGLQRMAATDGILYFVALLTGFALDAKGDPRPGGRANAKVVAFHDVGVTNPTSSNL
jgi:hypothetical protein